MDDVKNLIDALTLCIPQLDPEPLLAQPPASTSELDVLQWMADHLEQQELLVYEEWKEYDGWLPDLRSLSGIDRSAFDSSFVLGLMEDINWEEVDPDLVYTLPYELPHLEYMNFFLRDHGLRLVDLLYENAYIFCVKDDAQKIELLHESLQKFGIGINLRDAMDQQSVKAYIKDLLRAQ